MVIVAHISRRGIPVADVTYRSGMHVEVRVAKNVQDEVVQFPLVHSQNKELRGKWEEALDFYFNEGLFDSGGTFSPGEMRRIGCARDHKSLFREAAHALSKDLRSQGFRLEIEFL